MTCYVSITGTTTAGKTTLLKALQRLSDRVRVIPQATCRESRPDDQPDQFRFFSPATFEEQTFAMRHGRFGILKKDLSSLRSQPDSIGVSVNGVKEIVQLRGLQGLTTRNILIRYASDENAEMEILRKKINRFFSVPEVEYRLTTATQLNGEAFFNSQFIETNIDLVLERSEPLHIWLKKIWEELLGSPSLIGQNVYEEVATTTLALIKR